MVLASGFGGVEVVDTTPGDPVLECCNLDESTASILEEDEPNDVFLNFLLGDEFVVI